MERIYDLRLLLFDCKKFFKKKLKQSDILHDYPFKLNVKDGWFFFAPMPLLLVLIKLATLSLL
jgi:hypothetical protein